MYKIIALITFLICLNANSGNLIDNAEITAVSTSSDARSDNFFLRLSGGTGVCETQDWVVFPGISTVDNPTDIPNEAVWNRLYSTALMAFAAGKKIRVYSYSSSDCSKASFIEVYK